MENNYNYKQMGIRIAQRRKEISITQKDLASQVHISMSHLSNIENGKALPGFETFLDICCELKVTPDYIVLGTIYPDLNDEVVEKLKHCTDENKIKVSRIIDVFI